MGFGHTICILLVWTPTLSFILLLLQLLLLFQQALRFSPGLPIFMLILLILTQPCTGWFYLSLYLVWGGLLVWFYLMPQLTYCCMTPTMWLVIFIMCCLWGRSSPSLWAGIIGCLCL